MTDIELTKITIISFRGLVLCDEYDHNDYGSSDILMEVPLYARGYCGCRQIRF